MRQVVVRLLAFLFFLCPGSEIAFGFVFLFCFNAHSRRLSSSRFPRKQTLRWRHVHRMLLGSVFKGHHGRVKDARTGWRRTGL